MIELSSVRKNKINLSDYPYQKDIENRLLMAEFSVFDVEVLEEILFSPLKIPIKKLARSLETPLDQLMPILEKLGQTGLFSLQEDILSVEKEMRKYYESQLAKFDEDFHADMESLQAILKKVPIHILPLWYSIPRTSNNIFESIMEKYLQTPQTFLRYLMELSFDDPILSGIVQDVLQAPDFKVFGKDICAKYQISKTQFEECILFLEFNFICCLRYEKVGSQWEEIVTPFHEWKEYLSFLRDSKPSSIPAPAKIKRKRPKDFSFIEEMTLLLKKIWKSPIEWNPDQLYKYFEQAPQDPVELAQMQTYWKGVAEKLCLVKLALVQDGLLSPTEASSEWLEFNLENKALYLYRHPQNRLPLLHFPADMCTEKNIREAEKSIKQVFYLDWVYFDDFIKGALVILGEDSRIVLKKIGKSWKYCLPQYTESERAFIKATIFEWLFEVGMVAAGKADGRDCFCATSFGKTFFGA